MYRLTQQFTVTYSYPVVFSRDVFGQGEQALLDILRRPASTSRALVVIDSEVARLTPGLLAGIEYFAHRHREALEFVGPPLSVRGGEICKHDPVEVERIHALIDEHGLCRHSYLIAIGGGAVLDAAGYAAGTAHRGIRLIRMPSTVLAQNDAGIGVKNGVNAFGRKNFLGTFAPPFAVVNDFALLKTLPPRDRAAGMAEAVKVALIRDAEFFATLWAERAALAAFAPAALERMIVRCAELHLEHIAKSGDAFESGSSRPLDFGHWAGHALEELAKGELRHGEAVAIGMAIDALYSHRCGLLGALELQRILSLLEQLGLRLHHPALQRLDVARALRGFQEHLGGELSIPLLEGIGRAIDVHEIDITLAAGCVAALAQRDAARGANAHEQPRRAADDAVGARSAGPRVSRGARPDSGGRSLPRPARPGARRRGRA